MYKKYILLLIISNLKVVAATINEIATIAIANEPLVVNTAIIAKSIYDACIVTIPDNSGQVGACTAAYSSYISNLKILHFDITGINSTLALSTMDPYPWSPYDICRYDIANLIVPQLCGY